MIRRLCWPLRGPLDRLGESWHLRWHDRHDRGTVARLMAGHPPECDNPRCRVCGDGKPLCGWCLSVLREPHR